MEEKTYDEILDEILPWLEQGDRHSLAKSLDLGEDYVSRCLSPKGRSRSWRILLAAIALASDNKGKIIAAFNHFKRISDPESVQYIVDQYMARHQKGKPVTQNVTSKRKKP